MKTSFSGLTPLSFLQTFVLELMHSCEQKGHDQCEQLIERIARSASRFFEDAYREEFGKLSGFDKEIYADVIVGLKNKIGGNFSVASSDPGCIRVVNTQCPFGDGVKNSPELCRMTSSVFGGIAARNFGYAKVSLKQRIAVGDGMCEVCIFTDPKEAERHQGIEYTSENTTQNGKSSSALQHRIEERMHRIWCQMGANRRTASRFNRPTIVAQSAAMQAILHSVETVAPTVATILIRGETGTGKELIARAIHAMSERCEKPFLAVNCGAIPEGLIETTLFGHEKGAFTGAVEIHQGYFERAEGGTLFLDEIDSLSSAAQTRLLRILQEGELERVGGRRTIAVDTRIVAATNCDLDKAIGEGRFRRDLYYRINVVSLLIPPLSERPEDIPQLIQRILKRLNGKYNKQVESVSPSVFQEIMSYPWPGNVRELENTLERSLLFAGGSELTAIEIPTTQSIVESTASWKDVKQQAIGQIERDYLEKALKRFHGNVTQVAEWMELTTRAVYLKLKAYEINPAHYRS